MKIIYVWFLCGIIAETAWHGEVYRQCHSAPPAWKSVAMAAMGPAGLVALVLDSLTEPLNCQSFDHG